ncbi:MAG: O-antigen ligase family protein [Candidatus Promineifilaceae bacterium]|nr:O-antigen ligase family protein [Candidatus Promineifilaceae bacterium]
MITFGALNLLPVVAFLCWFATRPDLRSRVLQVLASGQSRLLLPLLLLTMWGFLGRDLVPEWYAFLYGGSLILFWFVLLFLVVERPSLTAVLSLVLLLQGGVAVGQFLLQRDLGLVWLGELELDATTVGMSVVADGEQHWLRAYGLTPHPNALGALLAVCWLLLLPAFRRAASWQRVILGSALTVGGLGLLVSFSRAAWLGAAVAAIALLVPVLLAWRRSGRLSLLSTPLRRPERAWLLLLILSSLLLVGSVGDLALGRFLALDHPLEAQSIRDRLRDGRLALQLFVTHPLEGVGLGNFREAARQLDETATMVHNVPLLVAAEFGGPGLLLWCWMALAPLLVALRSRSSISRLAPWLLLLTIGMFDITLWWRHTHTWQHAILLALVVAATLRPEEPPVAQE